MIDGVVVRDTATLKLGTERALTNLARLSRPIYPVGRNFVRLWKGSIRHEFSAGGVEPEIWPPLRPNTARAKGSRRIYGGTSGRVFQATHTTEASSSDGSAFRAFLWTSGLGEMLAYGTRAHVIAAKKATMLRFPIVWNKTIAKRHATKTAARAKALAEAKKKDRATPQLRGIHQRLLAPKGGTRRAFVMTAEDVIAHNRRSPRHQKKGVGARRHMDAPPPGMAWLFIERVNHPGTPRRHFGSIRPNLLLFGLRQPLQRYLRGDVEWRGGL